MGENLPAHAASAGLDPAEAMLSQEWDIGMDLDGNLSDLYFFDELLDPYYFQPHQGYTMPVTQGPSEGLNQPESAVADLQDQQSGSQRSDGNINARIALAFPPLSTVQCQEPGLMPIESQSQPSRVDVGAREDVTEESARGGQLNRRTSWYNEIPRGAVDNVTGEHGRDQDLNTVSSPSGRLQATNPKLLPSPQDSVSPSQYFLKRIATRDIVQAILDIPRRMLQRDHLPPFAHHMLYKPSEGRLNSALATALCCISAHMTMDSETEQFVCHFMDTERKRLVSDFVSISPCPLPTESRPG